MYESKLNHVFYTLSSNISASFQFALLAVLKSQLKNVIVMVETCFQMQLPTTTRKHTIRRVAETKTLIFGGNANRKTKLELVESHRSIYQVRAFMNKNKMPKAN